MAVCEGEGVGSEGERGAEKVGSTTGTIGGSTGGMRGTEIRDGTSIVYTVGAVMEQGS